MSEVDSLPSTPASGLNRRGLLRGAGGIAAAGAFLALPVSVGYAAAHSAELLEYRHCKASWLACFVEPYVEDAAWEARVSETGNAVEAAIAPFLKLSRAPRSWHDVIEIAEVFCTEMFDVGEDGELAKHSSNYEIDTMLLKAVLTAGGVHV